MPLLADIQMYKDVGVAGAALVIVIGLSRWVAIRSFQYIEQATNALIANQTQFIHFAEETLSKNTEALCNMHSTLEAHVKEKDDAISMLKQKDKTIGDLFELLKQEIKLNNAQK
jgi:hypothetical protein